MTELDPERYPVGRLPRDSSPLDAAGRAALVATTAHVRLALQKGGESISGRSR